MSARLVAAVFIEAMFEPTFVTFVLLVATKFIFVLFALTALIFAEFEFINFKDKTLVLKKSDDLINPTEGLKTEFLEAIDERLGYKISLIIESGDVIASPAVEQEQKAQDQLDQDKSLLLENPVLKDIVDSFDGKIIDESINKASS